MPPRLSKLTTKPHEVWCLTGFGRPFGINQDREGLIHITDMDHHAIFRVTPDLQPIAWPIKPGLLNGPHAIDFDEANNAYITTYYSPKIVVLNPLGQWLYAIGDEHSEHPLEGPASAFFDNQGRLLVTEYRQNTIHAYNKQGGYLGELGLKLSLNRPHMTKQGPDGLFYCADTWNHQVHCFSSSGDLLHTVAHPKLQHPVALSFSPNHELLVCSWSQHCLFTFSLKGEHLSTWDTLNLKNPYDAQWIPPWLVIADSHHGRVLFVKQFL